MSMLQNFQKSIFTIPPFFFGHNIALVSFLYDQVVGLFRTSTILLQVPLINSITSLKQLNRQDMTLHVKNMLWKVKQLNILFKIALNKYQSLNFCTNVLQARVIEHFREYQSDLLSIQNMQIIYQKKVTHSIKCRLIIRQILNCYVGVSSTFFAVMRCLLLFFFCGVGRDPSWLLHVKRENCIFFQLTNLFHTRFIPVSY